MEVLNFVELEVIDIELGIKGDIVSNVIKVVIVEIGVVV